jgi:hypothetical protein
LLVVAGVLAAYWVLVAVEAAFLRAFYQLLLELL